MLGTSSSEAALPRMITKLENAGCAESVVGLVIPAGYSFNLDGTSIYLTTAAIFIAQATNVHLSLVEQLGILGVLLLTSKGSAAVTGGGSSPSPRRSNPPARFHWRAWRSCWESIVSCRRPGPSQT